MKVDARIAWSGNPPPALYPKFHFSSIFSSLFLLHFLTESVLPYNKSKFLKVVTFLAFTFPNAAKSNDFGPRQDYLIGKLELTAPSNPQPSTFDKSITEVNKLFVHLNAEEKKYQRFKKAQVHWVEPTKEQRLLHYSYHHEEISESNPSSNTIILAAQTSIEGAISRRLAENTYLKALMSGFSFDLDPLALFSADPVRKPITYTIEAEYYAEDKPANDTANLEVDYYELEGAGKLKPVYRVVPVFNSVAYTAPSENLIEAHNKQVEETSYFDQLMKEVNLTPQNLLTFSTKLTPVRSGTDTNFSLDARQKAGYYRFIQNTANSYIHHFYMVPLNKHSLLTHQVKEKEVEKTSISYRDKHKLYGTFSLEKDHLTENSTAAYTQTSQLKTYTLRTSIDKDLKISKVEYVFNLSI